MALISIHFLDVYPISPKVAHPDSGGNTSKALSGRLYTSLHIITDCVVCE